MPPLHESQPALLRVSVFQSAGAGDTAADLLTALDDALGDAAGSDLLVCPELFLGGYRAGPRIADTAEPSGGPFAQAVADLARSHVCAVAYGYPEQAPTGKPYNAAAVIGSDGRLLANHRKQRLPGRYEKDWLQTGQGLTLFELKGWRIAVIVCYEVEFPEVVRACALKGAELVIVPTALSAEWPIVARSVVPARAFENGVFLAYSNHAGSDQGYTYLGESCIIGPDGQALARARDTPAVLSAVLDASAVTRARARIPFLADCQGLAGDNASNV